MNNYHKGQLGKEEMEQVFYCFSISSLFLVYSPSLFEIRLEEILKRYDKRYLFEEQYHFSFSSLILNILYFYASSDI
jgi:hypothetical protein